MNVEITFSLWKCIQPQNQLVQCVQIWSRIFSFGRVMCGEKCRFPHDWSKQKKRNLNYAVLRKNKKRLYTQIGLRYIKGGSPWKWHFCNPLCVLLFKNKHSDISHYSSYTRCVLKLSYSIQLIFNMNWQQN